MIDLSTPDGKLALSTMIAKRFARVHVEDVDDYAQEGVIGMLTAPPFDPSHGAPASTYLGTKARFAMVDALRRRGGRWSRKTRDFTAVPVSIDDVPEPQIANDADEAIARDQVAARVRRAIASLPDRERRIVQSYYYRGLTHRQIARAMRVHETRISQLHARARATLRALLTEDLCD